jgi:hypothetical protein
MKRLNVLLCAAAIVAMASPAGATQVYVGLLGGVNFADITGTDEASTRTCFSGGGLVEVDFTEQFGGRVELLYTQKGAQQEVFDPVLGDLESTLKLSYIEIPILFVAALTHSETAAFSIFGGPSIGFNMGADAEPSSGPSQDLSDDVNGTEFGAVLGVEFEHIRPDMTFFGDFRFSIGATEIFEDTPSNEDFKNRGFGLLVGLKIPIGSEN